MENVLNDMAKLAIKGHETKGDEVIEILGILGGSNAFGHIGNNPRAIYYIDETYKNFITCSETKKVCDCVIFTLEEFLEKYPYKVGDKVRIPEYESEVPILSMNWNGYEVQYEVFTDETEWYSAKELNEYNEPNKEETMEKEISGEIIDRFICLEGYDFYDDKGNIIDTKEITMKKKQPKSPKAYDECLEILGYNTSHTIPMNHGHKGSLIMKFQRLLICRDAYWKIAGELMGLGKPWEPDWLNAEQDKYVLFTHNNAICSNRYVLGHNILAFPTFETRDAFYENFKELINETKELL